MAITTEELLKIGKWATTLMHQIIPFSTNFPNPERQASHRRINLELSRHRAVTPIQKKFFNEIFNWHLDLSSHKERYPLNDSFFWVESLQKNMKFKDILKEIKTFPHMDLKYNDGLRWIEAIAARSLKFGVVNCTEASAYTMLLLMEYPTNGIEDLPKINEKVKIEFVYFDVPYPNDHVFLILNRDPNSPLNDITKWNDDTVICDPWSQEVYTKKEFLDRMNKEDREYMIKKFANLKKYKLIREDYYIGENHNKRVHTDEWLNKHDGQKYWRPKKLIDVKARPHIPEKLPPPTRLKKSINKKQHINFDLIENPSQVEEYLSIFGGIIRLNDFSMLNVYSKKDLFEYFVSLRQLLQTAKIPHELPLIISFGNLHADCEALIIFHNNSWLLYFESSDMKTVEKIKQETILVDKIFTAFYPANTFYSEILKTKKDIQNIEFLLSKWTVFQTWKTHLKQHKKEIKEFGISWLCLAIINEGHQVVHELLNMGVNPNLTYKGFTPLIFAAIKEDDESINLLLNYSADINQMLNLNVNDLYNLADQYNKNDYIDAFLEDREIKNDKVSFTPFELISSIKETHNQEDLSQAVYKKSFD